MHNPRSEHHRADGPIAYVTITLPLERWEAMMKVYYGAALNKPLPDVIPETPVQRFIESPNPLSSPIRLPEVRLGGVAARGAKSSGEKAPDVRSPDLEGGTGEDAVRPHQ